MSDLLDELTTQDLQTNNARKVIDEEYSSFDDSGEWFEFRIAGNEDRLSDKSHFESFCDDMSYVLSSSRIVESYDFKYIHNDEQKKVIYNSQYVVRVKLHITGVYELVKFFTALMRQMFKYYYSDSELDINGHIGRQDDENAVVFMNTFNHHDIEHFDDAKALLDDNQASESFFSIFRPFVHFQYKEIVAAKMRIDCADTFRRIKRPDKTASYIYPMEVHYKSVKESLNLTVNVSGHSWVEMLLKSLFVRESLHISSYYDRNGMTQSKFSDGAILRNVYHWTEGAPFSIEGPVGFFKRCVDCGLCLGELDKTVTIDVDAMRMSIEKAVKEYFWAQIVHEDIDVRTGVTEILQGIIDNFPIENIIYNMQEIKKILEKETQ